MLTTELLLFCSPRDITVVVKQEFRMVRTSGWAYLLFAGCGLSLFNLKKVLLKSHSREPHVIYLSANKDGAVTAADIKSDQVVEVLNPDQHICTLDKKMHFEIEL